MSLELEDQYEKIYRYCYFKVKNAQLAEDLTQETFLKFFSQNTYINRGKTLAYLYTISRNLCIDVYKKQESLPLEDDIIAKSDMAIYEEKLIIREAISRLPQDLQEIILLRFVNELSVIEISKITELSRFAVYRKIKNALSKLRLFLSEEDFCE
ncbi:RNA polymerase sigma factor [Vallitalea okinawensis]|uniref:RNA polymerase sigma factor n=1 Tax=Vallitalea okinawensis TaxID=2078660 RepID=UPI000CFE1D3D|nr:RNA polymerase sigma factor [Vallitalea okinawensis]